MSLTSEQILSLECDDTQPLIPATIVELMESILAVGVKQSLLVVQDGDRMKVIDGRHRVEALRRLIKLYPRKPFHVKAFVIEALGNDPASQPKVEEALLNVGFTQEDVLVICDALNICGIKG